VRKLNTLTLKVVLQFADRLDRRDYDGLRDLLAADCRYELPDRRLVGCDAIIEAYRAGTEWAFAAFDQIDFESDLVAESDTSARVTFTDHLRSGERTHVFRCQQIVEWNSQGKIARIVHVDLPGEQTALREFFAKCGVVPPAPQC
jgi:hypothetical protein